MLQRFQRIRETDMKKLILITGILLSTSLWADMDKVCHVRMENEANGYMTFAHYDFIEKNCERNNILLVERINNSRIVLAKARFCRFDRESDDRFTHYSSSTETEYQSFTCVLYDNKSRSTGAKYDIRD